MNTNLQSLFDEIEILRKKYSKENHHRLQFCLNLDMDEWTASFGIEAWACQICSATVSEWKNKNARDDCIIAAIASLRQTDPYLGD